MNTIQLICEALSDHTCADKGEEYRNYEKTYCDTMEALVGTLTHEQKRLFFQLEADRNLLAAMDEDRMFLNGFRQGASLILKLLLL